MAVLFDNIVTSSQTPMESDPVSISSTLTQKDDVAVVDIWQGSMHRQRAIQDGVRRGRDLFNSTQEYVDYWDDYLTGFYDYMKSKFEAYDWRWTNAWLTFAFETPFSVLMSAFGVVSNIVILTVFYRLGVTSDSCTTILTGIAISDLIYCVLTLAGFLVYIPTARGYFSVGAFTESDTDLVNARTILTTPEPVFVQFNYFATTYLSLERMISVVFPFHVQRYFNSKRSFVIQVVLFLLCWGLQFHILSLLRLEQVYNARTGNTFLGLVATNLISEKYIMIMTVVNAFGVRSVCIVAIVVFNSIIIVKVRMAEKRKRAMTSPSGIGVTSAASRGRDARGILPSDNQNQNRSSSSRESKLTRLMTGVCVMFLLCYTPGVASVIIFRFFKLDGRVNDVMVKTINILELTNSCFSILIYYALSSKFKEKLREMCPCCKHSD